MTTASFKLINSEYFCQTSILSGKDSVSKHISQRHLGSSFLCNHQGSTPGVLKYLLSMYSMKLPQFSNYTGGNPTGVKYLKKMKKSYDVAVTFWTVSGYMCYY
ncbi:unnamed protein product [Allacma fusca]|uniref:Uncharacterized protein n=1 Tax=Allacma fusca TaxID=39272 RepID=A0A8J2JJC7_9HEXA|nr:unnamed protein product [Allacma fusca]